MALTKKLFWLSQKKCLENIHKDSITLIPHTEIIKDDRDYNNQSGEGK